MSTNIFGTAAVREEGAWIEVDKLQPGEDYKQLYASVGSASGSYQIDNLNSAFTKASPPDPNGMPELSMSLEMAHGMWAAKWGWDWIPATTLQDASGLNWYRLALRLQRMSLLENWLELDVYKLVPKTWT